MTEKIHVCVPRRRGEVIETAIHDLTRVGNPIGARIYEVGEGFIVIPEDDQFPVVKRDNFHSAANYFEQIVGAEDKGAFHF